MQYAGEDHPTYPKDSKIRAKISEKLLFEASVWFPTNYVYLVEYVVKPLLKAEPDEKVIEAEAPKWNENAKILDEQLGKTKWIVGNEITIADFALAAPMHLHEAMKLPLDKYPNLKRWMAAVEAIPEWKASQEAVDKALLPNKKGKASQTNGTSGGTLQADFV
jgi:glutathione S-transferase